MTNQTQGKPKYDKKRKFNRTPKKNKPNRSSSGPHKKAVVALKAPPKKIYLCSSCGNPVVKRNYCGKVLEKDKRGKKVKIAGLGKFKCPCGTTKVSVKKAAVSGQVVTSELKAAA